MSNGEPIKKGPVADRFLLRLKDAIIIGTAGIALIKWFYVNPVQIQDRVTRQEQLLSKQQQTLEKIAENLQVQTSKLGDIEKRFVEFQRTFYARKPGGWVYEDDRWKWDTSDKTER